MVDPAIINTQRKDAMAPDAGGDKQGGCLCGQGLKIVVDTDRRPCYNSGTAGTKRPEYKTGPAPIGL